MRVESINNNLKPNCMTRYTKSVRTVSELLNYRANAKLWRGPAGCDALQWFSLGECHKPDRSSLLSHCAVSIVANKCLACLANFSAIKNKRFSWATYLCEILFQIKGKVFRRLSKCQNKSLGRSITQTDLWYERCRDGRNSVEDNDRSWRTST